MLLRYFFIVFFINLCFTTFNLKAEILPNWYKSVENTKLYIYGFGYGNNLAESVKDALENIKKNLLKNYEGSDLDINLINFSNYDIEKQEKIGDKIYISLVLRRNELYSLQLQQLNELFLNINNLYEFLDKKNNFVKFVKFKEILNLANEMKEKIKIIKLIDRFDDSKYSRLCKKLEQEYVNLTNNLDVRIEIDRKKIGFLLDSVIKNVEKNSPVKVDKNSKNVLNLTYKAKMIKVDDNYVVNVLFCAKILDKNGDLISYDSFEYGADSGVSFDDAVVKAVENFGNDLDGGVVEVVNIG